MSKNQSSPKPATQGKHDNYHGYYPCDLIFSILGRIPWPLIGCSFVVANQMSGKLDISWFTGRTKNIP